MKKSTVISASAATIGLATILTFAAVAPSEAKSLKQHAAGKSYSAPQKLGHGKHDRGQQEAARQFTSVNFTVSNIPATITDANEAAKLLVVKVAPLAADATAAPETAPVPPKGHGPRFDGTNPPAPEQTAPTPPAGDSGKKLGFEKGRMHGHGPKMMLSNLVLSNGVLTGTIELPGAPVAGVQNFGVYLSIAADSANGIVAQNATPVMVTVTTAADLSVSVTATTGDVAISLPTA